MAEFLPPSMPEPQPIPHDPPAGPPPPAPPMPAEPVAAAPVAAEPRPTRRAPGALARLVSLIVSVGLAWALTVAITAWLLGLFLARG
jgi:hypothetical protein